MNVVSCLTLNFILLLKEKLKVRKMVLDPGELWPLAPRRLTWGQIWRHVSDSPIHCASSLFCRSKLSVLVWVRDRLKQSAARLTKKCENFALMTSFDLEDVDLRSPNLHHKEFLCWSTHPPSFVFLAFLGAEIAGGAEYVPPPGRVILRPSPRAQSYQVAWNHKYAIW